jgi:hypothetical protein
MGSDLFCLANAPISGFCGAMQLFGANSIDTREKLKRRMLKGEERKM